MRVDFARNSNQFPPIEISGKPLGVVDEAKLLGLTCCTDCTILLFVSTNRLQANP